MSKAFSKILKYACARNNNIHRQRSAKNHKDKINLEIFKISLKFHQAKTIQIRKITCSKTDSVMGVFTNSDISLSMQHHAS